MKFSPTNSGTKAIWISFDFGLKGDYKNLYAWLDNHNALDCGQGLAFVKYPINKIISRIEFKEKIIKDIKESVKLSKTDRIYIIYKDDTKIKGDFINGSRKVAPWEGYGDLKDQQSEDGGE